MGWWDERHYDASTVPELPTLDTGTFPAEDAFARNIAAARSEDLDRRRRGLAPVRIRSSVA